jgi:hypothetical protein
MLSEPLTCWRSLGTLKLSRTTGRFGSGGLYDDGHGFGVGLGVGDGVAVGVAEGAGVAVGAGADLVLPDVQAAKTLMTATVRAVRSAFANVCGTSRR